MSVVEFTSNTPVKEQLEVISETGVYISVHTSNLANAQFLRPGSAVFEIIQRNWAWADMDQFFKVSRLFPASQSLEITLFVLHFYCLNSKYIGMNIM